MTDRYSLVEGGERLLRHTRIGEDTVATLSDFVPLALPKEILAGWQSASEIMAEVLKVPVGVVTRLRGKNLEVLVTNQAAREYFQAGEEVGLLGSGSYAEEVIRIRGLLKVSSAKKSRRWQDSSSLVDGFQAYLGLPLFLPGGQVFGTICAMDRRPRIFGGMHEALLFRFKELVEAQLALLIVARDQRQRSRLLETYKDELAQLREVFPICPKCKQIRNDSEYWDAVEDYFVTHAMGEFGHGLCPDCSEKHWGETLIPPEPVPLPRGLGSGGPAKA